MLDRIPLKLPPRSALGPGDLVTEGTNGQAYRIRGLIAQGGQGEVYLGEKVDTGERVAVKTTSVRLLGDETTELRARWETVMLRRLRHPNVVVVHGTGICPNGAPFMVMDLLVGMTLTELRVAFGKIPIAWSLEIMRDACLGLEAIHALAIHRDIKPGNLHFAVDAVTRLIDLGAAKWKDSRERVTTTGTHLGTYTYMAPEQLDESAPLDARTDLWAIGVVLYELLADRHPFEIDGKLAAGSYRLGQQIIHEPHVPLPEVAPLAPDFVRFIVDRALEKDLRKRFRSAEEMATVLDGALARFRSEHEASPPLADLASRMFPDGYMRLSSGLLIPVPQRATRTTVPMTAPATSQPTALPNAQTEPVAHGAPAGPEDVPAEAPSPAEPPRVEEPSIAARPSASSAPPAEPAPSSSRAGNREPWVPAAPPGDAPLLAADQSGATLQDAGVGARWHVPTRHMRPPAVSEPAATSSTPVQAHAVAATITPRPPARNRARMVAGIAITAAAALGTGLVGTRALPPSAAARTMPPEASAPPLPSVPPSAAPATPALPSASTRAVEPVAVASSASTARAPKLTPNVPRPRPSATGSAPAVPATAVHRYPFGVEQ